MVVGHLPRQTVKDCTLVDGLLTRLKFVSRIATPRDYLSMNPRVVMSITITMRSLVLLDIL